jgi:hypothetical protein
MSTIAPSRIENYEDVFRFLLAGRAVFTLLDTRNSLRSTYKVKQSKKSANLYYVEVKLNDAYRYIGSLNSDTMVFSVAKHFMPDHVTLSIKYFKAFCLRMSERAMPEFIHFYHEGICAKCGSALTVPESITNGLGPVCKKRMKDFTIPMTKSKSA